MIMSGDVVNRPSNCSGNAEHMTRMIIAASRLNISTIPVSFLIAQVSFSPVLGTHYDQGISDRNGKLIYNKKIWFTVAAPESAF